MSTWFSLQQPETKGEGLKDHVEEESKLATDNDVEMNKKN